MSDETPDEFQSKRQDYILLSMLINGELTFKLADDAQRKVDEFIMLSPVDQQEKLDKLKPYAPRPVTARQVQDSFDRMFPRIKQWCGWNP